VIEHSTLEGWALRLKKARRRDDLSVAVDEPAERRLRRLRTVLRDVSREMLDALVEDKICNACADGKNP
jgi:hypothetical protein